jgi:hypothetical protein
MRKIFQNLESYERQAALLTKKIDYLKECHIVADDGAKKFELGETIKACEKELEEVNKAISDALNPYSIFPNEMLAELLETLKNAGLSENDLKNAYHTSIPASIPDYFPEINLPSAVAHLADIREKPILEFIQRTAAVTDKKTAQNLKGLSEQIASEREISPDAKQTQPEAPRKADPFAPYLLVIIRPDPGNENKEDREKLYTVQMFFWRNAKENISWYDHNNPPVPLDNIPELLNDNLAKDRNGVPRKPSEVPETIELFLPVELISCDADQWPLKKRRFKSKIGKQYHVVIRSFERLEELCSEELPSESNPTNPIVYKEWAERWEQFQRLNDSDAVFWICEPDEYEEAESLCDELECEEHTCIMMAFQPSDEFLDVILETGIPVALWFRNEGQTTLTPKEIRDKIESLISGKDLCRLPGLIKEIRKKAKKNVIGDHLTLFWEDYDRIPEFNRWLNAPETRK